MVLRHKLVYQFLIHCETKIGPLMLSSTISTSLTCKQVAISYER